MPWRACRWSDSGLTRCRHGMGSAVTTARMGADVMVLRGMKPSKGLVKKGVAASVALLSSEERAIIEKVNACQITRVRVDRLRPSPRHARVHSEAKRTALSASIRRFGVIEPIIVDQDFTIIAGVARWMACQALGVAEVPIVSVEHLSPIEVRALRIAMGRFPEWATWDRDQLRIELPAIVAELPDLAMEEIGLSVQEVDRLIVIPGEHGADPADDIPPAPSTSPISRIGDLWKLDDHFVLCGNALHRESFDQLLGSTAVRLVLTDPPYNVPVNGHVTKRIGKFAEFAMASGELSQAQFYEFLRTVFQQIARVSVAGAIGYIFIDWRHARLMQEAADGVLFELKNHIVWVKDAPALGSFYRSQHEFVLVSFPKIISARSDDAVHPRRAQQRRYQTVGLLDAVAHPCAVIGACAIHYGRWRTCSEFASGAPRQRSASDPGTRDAQCRSGAPHTRFARAIWARSGGHEYPWLSVGM